MRLGKLFVLGLAGSMLAASILSLASLGPSASGADGEPMSIPLGRFGDRVEYQGSRVTTAADTPALPTPVPYTYAVEVLGASQTVDRWAHVHDVVVVAQRHSAPGEIAIYNVSETARVDYVELNDRDSIRVDRFNEGVGSIASFGPIGPRGTLAANHSMFRHQGHTLAVGAALLDREAQLGGCVQLPSDATRHITASSYTVSRAGRIAGARAFELRLEQTYWEVDREGNRIDGRLVETTWVTQASPYPVRILELREEHGPSGVKITNDTRWLTSHRPGGEQIPWGRPSAARCPVVGNPSLARSGTDALFPKHGDEKRFRYTLEEAYQSVRNDRTLVSFQAWMAANPDHRLVGAYSFLNSTNATALNPFESWGLYFGGRDDVVVVQSQRPAEGGAAMNVFLDGEKAGPRPSIKPEDGPKNPLTLGQVAKIYLNVASTNWTGYDQFTFGHNGPMAAKWDPHGPPTPEGVKWYYTELQVGRMQWLRELGAARERMAILDVNLTTGEVLFYREGPYWFYLPRAGSTPTQAPIAPAEVTSVRMAPTFQNGAVAAMGALAVFLFIYFFPAIKFLATKLLEAWPGYAKLDRDEVLGHKLREELQQLIRRKPGITPPQLRVATGAAWSTLVYHLGVLEKNKLVSSLLDGRHKRFFPFGEVGWGDRETIAVLQNQNTRRAFDGVAAKPGIIQADLAVEVGVTAQAIKWHVDRLLKAGLVRREKAGRSLHVYPEPEPAKVVA